jgi:hypothetical protein
MVYSYQKRIRENGIYYHRLIGITSISSVVESHQHALRNWEQTKISREVFKPSPLIVVSIETSIYPSREIIQIYDGAI